MKKIILGLLGQIVVGVVQIITMIYLWFHFDQMSQKLKDRHVAFTVATAFYLLFFFVSTVNEMIIPNLFMAIVFYVIIPMFGIGLFGLSNLYMLKKELEERDNQLQGNQSKFWNHV